VRHQFIDTGSQQCNLHFWATGIVGGASIGLDDLGFDRGCDHLGDFLEIWPQQARSRATGFYLRGQLEGLPACVLHRAKPVNCTWRPHIGECADTANNMHTAASLLVQTPSAAAIFQKNPKKPTMPHSSTHQHAGAYGANLASLITLTFLLCMLVTPLNAHAKKHKTQKASTHQTSASKGAGKTTYRPSPSEESRAERERRLFRECRGMPNAGACRGFTQR
jgi:hypothetical protein